MALLNKVVYLSDEQASSLFENDTITVDGVTINYSDNDLYITPATEDSDTTYTFTNGTNGFTVTPSNGTAQTVTVTPSITNNITGSGTSGNLVKFNGTNTITDGPAFDGSTTTKALTQKGTWETFLQSHQDITGKADKSATVSTLTWDSTNKKITKTINGTTTDVVQFIQGSNVTLTGAAGSLTIAATGGTSASAISSADIADLIDDVFGTSSGT